METIIRVRDLVKRYGEDLVLDHITLDIRKGESIGIVGPNGAGKSTFLRVLAGIEPYDSGTVEVDGSIGFVPQETVLLPWRTLRGNILLAAKIRGIERHVAEKILEENAEILAISGYLDMYPSQVSGGTARKAQILMALVLNPDILLLDEPFTGLDMETIESFQAQIKELKEVHNLTIITVSHMMDELMEISDRLIMFTHKPARIRRILQVK
ncbi:MAG: ATP-binding cassette domain-containing protein [Desulfurococcales archaeon]|nr:ATP-binding cassette domain-containing protein [Desulfurococcales archaeon]